MNDMNTDLALFSIAVGGIVKIITLRSTSPGDRIGAVFILLVQAAVLGLLVPDSGAYAARVALVVWAVGDIFLKPAGMLVNKIRVKWEVKKQKAKGYLNGYTTKGKRP